VTVPAQGLLRPAQHLAAEEVTMKTPARLIAAAALAALAVLPASVAQADPSQQERGVPPTSRPVDRARARLALERTLGREHHTYPTPTNQAAWAARLALIRTLAREHHAYPTSSDQAATAAQLALIRTLGREHHAYPAPTGQPAANAQPPQPTQSARSSP
jgi:hypothetical protein